MNKLKTGWFMTLGLIIYLCCPGYATADNTAVDEVDFFDLSIEELSEITITAASEFTETPLSVASSVSTIQEKDWQKYGARRSNDALSHLPGVDFVSIIEGSQAIRIRGYSSVAPRGHAYLLDGVPINSFAFNTSSYNMNNAGIYGLQNIELIRGPVAVQYGTDAFHGAVAMQSYGADSPETRIHTAVASNNMATLNLRHTSDFNNHIMNVSLQSLKQGDQEQSYSWTDSSANLSGTGSWENKEEFFMGMVKLRSQIDSGWYYDVGLYLKEEELDNFPGYGNFFGTSLRDRDLFSNHNNLQMVRAKVGHHLDNDIDMEVEGFHWRSGIRDHRWRQYSDQRQWSKDEFRSGINLTVKQEDNPLNTRWSLALP
ncbi:MAG: TonB-dependent receptor plug domain-containing protein [Magnetococcales bacterium]|nr:TonB-dependent receptor plug domain-containing protein [Magnetococcales bacterium]